MEIMRYVYISSFLLDLFWVMMIVVVSFDDGIWLLIETLFDSVFILRVHV
jgi:hypothetical protein